jgi:hypothetical protein
LVSTRGLTTPGAGMTYADADSYQGHMRLSLPAHMHTAGSVDVLLNLDTTPVQLHTTPFQTPPHGAVGPASSNRQNLPLIASNRSL